MMARCKLNPCCGATVPGECEPPPQINPGEGWEAYEQRTSPALVSEPAAEGEAAWDIQGSEKWCGERVITRDAARRDNWAKVPDVNIVALYAHPPAAEAIIAGLQDKVRSLTTLLDRQMGTPCEQIRYQQEIELITAERDQSIYRWAKAEAKLETMASALAECEDYFDNRADADCDQDGFIPNKEMRLLTVVREALRTDQAVGEGDVMGRLAFPKPKPGYAERVRVQCLTWAIGRAVHNRVDDECCPDFSCCHPELFTTDAAERWATFHREHPAGRAALGASDD